MLSTAVVISKLAVNSETIRIEECFGGSSPEAIGKCCFWGFDWSLFLSKYWLRTKMAPVTREKEIAIGSTL